MNRDSVVVIAALVGVFLVLLIGGFVAFWPWDDSGVIDPDRQGMLTAYALGCGFMVVSIGLIIVIASRPRCPECRNVVRRDARKCPYCQSMLN